MGKVLAALAIFLATAALTVLLVVAVIGAMPCSAFGSSFEGACGYGAIGWIVVASLVLAPLAGTWAVVFYLRRLRRGAAAD